MADSTEQFDPEALMDELRPMTADGRAAMLEKLGRSAPELRRSLEHRLLDESPTMHECDSPTAIDKMPDRVGSYELQELIGIGGMGRIFKARHRWMHRTVAIKLMTFDPDHPNKNAMVRRFMEREVRASANLHHPNVVAAFDAGEQDGHFFLVMEYVEGKTLAEILRVIGRFSPARAVAYTLQAARGLAYAHDAGVIHRDIKPSNLILDPRGVVKVLDMGLAKPHEPLMPSEHSITDAAFLVGSVNYMSPEHAENPKNADRRSDIYSLGCTLFRLMTGRPPYPGKTTIETIIAQREKPRPRLSDHIGWVPEGLQQVLDKTLHPDPAHRYQRVEEMITDLEPVAKRMERDADPDERYALELALRLPAGAPTSRVTAHAARPRAIWAIGLALAMVAGTLWLTQQSYIPNQGTSSAPPAPSAPDIEAATSPTLTAEQYASLRPAHALKGHDGNVISLSMDPSGRRLASIGSDGAFRLWDAHTGQSLPLTHDTPQQLTSVLFSPDGQWLLMATETGSLLLCDPATGSVQETRPYPFGAIRVIASISNGSRILIGGGHRDVLHLNLRRQRPPQHWKGHSVPIQALAWAGDGQTAISGDADGQIYFWDSSAETSFDHRDAHPGGVQALTYRGQRVAISGGADGYLRYWDLITRQIKREIMAHEGGVTAVAYLDGLGVLLSTGADGRIAAWTSTKLELIGVTEQPGDVIHAMATSEDGRVIATAGSDGVIRLWTPER